MANLLILASSSAIRASLLQNAGMRIKVYPAYVDEISIKASMLEENESPRNICDALADLKAMRVSSKFPDAMVLGCDQVLVCSGHLFEKPKSIADAKDHLCELRGKAHELLSAAVIYENGMPVWRHIGRAQLIMRPFSDAFLDNYILKLGDDLLTTVGAYKLEGLGSQLFSRVQGDYFSVLGLPLLELLGFFQKRGMIIE